MILTQKHPAKTFVREKQQSETAPELHVCRTPHTRLTTTSANASDPSAHPSITTQPLAPGPTQHPQHGRAPQRPATQQRQQSSSSCRRSLQA